MLNEHPFSLPEQVHQLARDLFSQAATLALVGPFRSTTKFEKVLS